MRLPTQNLAFKPEGLSDLLLSCILIWPPHCDKGAHLHPYDRLDQLVLICSASLHFSATGGAA